jgi:hypothetical protein
MQNAYLTGDERDFFLQSQSCKMQPEPYPSLPKGFSHLKTTDLAKGVRMNIWQAEFAAEEHRQRILEEVEQIRLEKVALQSRARRPRLVTRTLFKVANGLISAGRQLHKLCEVSQEEKWIDPRTKVVS